VEKLDDNQLAIQYEIPTKNFDLMEDFGESNTYNCSLKFDKYAIVYCQKEPFTYFKNYLAIVKFSDFFRARTGFVKAAKTI
jgi:hypothetical protein